MAEVYNSLLSIWPQPALLGLLSPLTSASQRRLTLMVGIRDTNIKIGIFVWRRLLLALSPLHISLR